MQSQKQLTGWNALANIYLYIFFFFLISLVKWFFECVCVGVYENQEDKKLQEQEIKRYVLNQC